MSNTKFQVMSNVTLQQKKFNISNYTIYLALAAVIVLFTVLCAMKGINFLSWTVISNIIVQTTVISVIAIGTTMVILTGGIDLSVGSLLGVVGTSAALLMNGPLSVGSALLVGLLIGALVGFINGVGVSICKIPPFIMTLGMMMLLAGVRLQISGGHPVTGMPNSLGTIASTKIFGIIPIFILYVIILYIAMVFVMEKTRFGRHIYAFGGNRRTAKLSGVNVRKVEILTYTIAGIFAALGGVLLLARLQYASANAGTGYEMDVLAASILGGISLAGGQGKLINTLIGALMIGVMKAGLQILNVPAAFQNIIIGLIIIIAVFFDKAKERKAE